MEKKKVDPSLEQSWVGFTEKRFEGRSHPSETNILLMQYEKKKNGSLQCTWHDGNAIIYGRKFTRFIKMVWVNLCYGYPPILNISASWDVDGSLMNQTTMRFEPRTNGQNALIIRPCDELDININRLIRVYIDKHLSNYDIT